MKKRKAKKPPKKRDEKSFKIINIVSIATVALIIIGSFFYITQDKITQDTKQSIPTPKIEEHYKENSITFEEKTKALEIEYVSNTDDNIYTEKPVPKKEDNYKFYYEEPEDIKVNNTVEIATKVDIPQINKTGKIKEEKIYKEKKIEILKKTKENKKRFNKPKLAIIIDDVTTSRQIDKIKKIGYTVNIAFLPPTKHHKNSAKIARNIENYMIHLPLQASSSLYEEEKTLYITHSMTAIDSRIRALKQLYPKAKFVNNHTGSKFTSNKEAMDKLFQVLKKYDLIFIDSRTTAKSVARLSAKKYGVRMLSRNIFLDNKRDEAYIRKQLKKAIKIAKKNGSAIAIGHPYGITFSTLKNSKHLLKDLDLIYVNQL